MEILRLVVNSIYFHIVMWTLICAALTVMVYMLLKYLIKYSDARSNLQTAYMRMQEAERDRMSRAYIEQVLRGMGAKKNLLERFDELIAYSGLGDVKFKFRDKRGNIHIYRITSEICISAYLVLMALVFLVGIRVFRNVLFAAILMAVVTLMLYIALQIACHQRNKSIEAQMIKFLNLLDNFSTFNADLVEVLRQCATYLNGTLSALLWDAVHEIRTSGNIVISLRHLQDRVSSKYFKQLVYNLALACNFETNYTDVVKDIREIYKVYTKHDKEKASVKFAGALQTVLLIGVGIMSLQMLGGVTGTGNIIVALNSGGAVGQGILIFLVIAVVLAVYVGIIKVVIDD